jgi:hypothetical protein
VVLVVQDPWALGRALVVVVLVLKAEHLRLGR